MTFFGLSPAVAPLFVAARWRDSDAVAAACWWGRTPTTDAIAANRRWGANHQSMNQLSSLVTPSHSRGAGLDGRPDGAGRHLPHVLQPDERDPS